MKWQSTHRAVWLRGVHASVTVWNRTRKDWSLNAWLSYIKSISPASSLFNFLPGHFFPVLTTIPDTSLPHTHLPFFTFLWNILWNSWFFLFVFHVKEKVAKYKEVVFGLPVLKDYVYFEYGRFSGFLPGPLGEYHRIINDRIENYGAHIVFISK